MSNEIIRMKYNLIKLGGSIITDPGQRGIFNKKNASRLAKELFPFHNGCILIHGTGHIGKPPAIKYNYFKTGIIAKKDHLIALRIKESIRKLNQRVVEELLHANIPAIPMDIFNFSIESTNAKGYISLKTILEQLILNGFVPVFYGDLLIKADGSFKVISSDFITLIISKILNPENVIFLTDVNGVYAKNAELNQSGNVILPYISESHMNMIGTHENDLQDVSGGMRKKVEIALEISNYCHLCFIGSGYTKFLIHDFFKNYPVAGTVVKSNIPLDTSMPSP